MKAEDDVKLSRLRTDRDAWDGEVASDYLKATVGEFRMVVDRRSADRPIWWIEDANGNKVQQTTPARSVAAAMLDCCDLVRAMLQQEADPHPADL